MMRRFYLIVYFVAGFLLQATPAFSQTSGELYITSYDNNNQPVFFCDGVRENEVQISYGVANIFYKTDPFVLVDSITYVCDKSIFQYTQTIDSFTLGIAGFYFGPIYSPVKIGTDTLKIVGYYGQYTTTATVICHAVASPEIGMFGFVRTAVDYGAGTVSYDLNPQIRADTLHDEMNGGFPYHVSATPQNPGVNAFVEMLSCGGGTIDSIYTVGDFSEFEFLNMPVLPLTLHARDSLRISYLFTPHVVGKFPHFLVFHTTNNKYLVWSFEYKVSGNNDVVDYSVTSEEQIMLLPNPASSCLKIRVKQNVGAYLNISIINSLGRVVKEMNLDSRESRSFSNSTEIETDVSGFASGAYTVICTTESGAISKRLIIVR